MWLEIIIVLILFSSQNIEIPPIREGVEPESPILASSARNSAL
jgi:hypothetical protein